ncbi:lytic transglycosylase domain-containing protein [Nocardioides daeguensis]|uniref:Transglycosylase SLT domain-containing protein n=1 Tax=Nocardioides daeguensis TaxID=908359 RepID=A0ABP6V2C4_9ACTN|nr:lytic murein transglycosylase [Nocardioides daeguensis]MBV6727025.1 lytic murein transglycosylase [Nocardioides daeguensis]MCR1771572.1 lytic murein transglycosylase [Nocardioides daeguensis]
MPRPDRYLVGAIGLAVLTVALVIGVGVAFAYDASSARRRTPPPAQPAPAVTGAAPAAPAAPALPATAPDPYRPDAAWLARVAGQTGIPPRALAAYARAHLRVAAEQPGCRVAWNSLAAIGGIESHHGSVDGSALGDDGVPRPRILGPVLDGGAFGAVHDTDGGVLDGESTWDRAIGPLQFIPSTWLRWGADGNGDGVVDPNQIDDAALAAARYLCHAGDLADPDTWRSAVFSFNHSDTYVADIADLANVYASRAR